MADTTELTTARESLPDRFLIVNADDFGMSPGINHGIMEAVAAGVVTSTSLMIGMPASDDAIQAARRGPRSLGIGLHLRLTVGRPLTRAETLVDAASGEFLSLPELMFRALTGGIRTAEVVEECRSQIAQARRTGLRLTHLDGHQHVHLLPGIAGAVRRVVSSEGIGVVRLSAEPLFGPARWWRRFAARATIKTLAMSARIGEWSACTTDHFVGSVLMGARDFEAGLLRVLDELPVGTTELMVHPGHAVGPLPGGDTYIAQRETELRALLSPVVRERLQGGQIRLVNFAALSSR